MEKMDGHLFDAIHQQYGILTSDQQKQVLRLFKTLDKINVFHGDANMMNYMYKGSKLYIIDFGYSKKMDESQIKKLGTTTPNMEIMLLAFIMKLKDMKCPHESYSTLLTYMSPEKKATYNL
jgi:tRNA A-37 threonylcarbamoyl transferase component Bud32